MNPYKVFHIGEPLLKKNIDVICVRPEQGGNIGAAARALENMGIEGRFIMVGSPQIIDDESRKFACHAQRKLEAIQHYPSLKEALEEGAERRSKWLVIAATARVGSAHRPHPLRVDEAIPRALDQLKRGMWDQLIYVFGSESNGLENDEVALCDWVVTIPSTERYRSLNLAQAMLIFAYETQRALLLNGEAFESAKLSQKEKLVQNIVQVAEEVGFILPGDPFKMRPKLEGMLAGLPRHIPEVATWHGLLDQVRRSVRQGTPDIRGRYRRVLNEMKDGKRKENEIGS